MDERLRATLDRFVLSAPRQDVLMLGEIVIGEWEALNEPPGWQLSDSRNGRD